MTTYWVLGKGISASQVTSPGPMQAGIPQAQSQALQRQTSHHSSLAAVVFGMMQANKRSTNINATRKSMCQFIDWVLLDRPISVLKTKLNYLMCQVCTDKIEFYVFSNFSRQTIDRKTKTEIREKKNISIRHDHDSMKEKIIIQNENKKLRRLPVLNAIRDEKSRFSGIECIHRTELINR